MGAGIRPAMFWHTSGILRLTCVLNTSLPLGLAEFSVGLDVLSSVGTGSCCSSVSTFHAGVGGGWWWIGCTGCGVHTSSCLEY